MVVGKHSKSIVKAKGSTELNDKLQNGDLRRIAEAFNETYPKVRYSIVGKHFGDIRIIRCAEALASFYDEVNLKEKVQEIINEYSNG